MCNVCNRTHQVHTYMYMYIHVHVYTMCMIVYLLAILPSNQSFYRQIAGYQRGVR